MEFTFNPDFKIEDHHHQPSSEEIYYQRLRELGACTPKSIVSYLDQYVIGQEAVKKALAVATVNHRYRVFHNAYNPRVRLRKSCLMITGPTGSGKTLSISKIAELIDLPFVTVDCTELTSAGYVGRDVGSIFESTIRQYARYPHWDGNMIVYLDEIDKIAASPGSKKDVNGAAVQQALLKMIEGGDITVEIDKRDIQFNTDNVMFIMSGAFTNLRESLDKKSKKTPIGFQSEAKGFHLQITPKDLINAGMIRELIGRVGRIVEATELDAVTLKRILVEPVDSLLKQYSTLLELRDIDFDLTTLDLDDIVKEALDKKVGARGLRNILEERLEDVMFT